MTPLEVADIIRNDPTYIDNMPVKFWACNTGFMKSGFAQQLANILQTTVIAPDTFVWYNTTSNRSAVPYVADSLGQWNISTFKGNWIKFQPGSK